MFFAGLLLIVAAAVGVLAVKPRNGIVQRAADGFVGDLVALGITITGAIGIVTTLISLGRL